MLFTPLRIGGFTTPTIYDAITLIVNSRHSVKGIISMPFAQSHVFLVNDQHLQTSNASRITSSTSMSMPASAMLQPAQRQTAPRNLFDRPGADTQRKASYSPVVNFASERAPPLALLSTLA
ncbi:hypothetical protein SP68_24360 [Klebsiella variicola]|nr:hypothetical protein SP68_24360 [Klebsiella variicola]MDT7003766.1 hypothetical protein [Klebsiella variicola]MDT7024188.1 hypothetical protein [Klebsiella variicola]OCV48410.1 hypothetical protein A9P88_21095 [Klebsiella quasipneumoniae subsp. similipneumoniae]